MNHPIYFDDVAVGDAIPPRVYGPLTIVDTVRWAGLQENWQHLHYDRDHVRQHNGLKTFIASGAYRQALPLTDVLHVTRVHATVAADTWFPPVDPHAWIEVAREEHPADARHAHAYDFVELHRAR